MAAFFGAAMHIVRNFLLFRLLVFIVGPDTTGGYGFVDDLLGSGS
jgi:hypothetical protein